MSALWLFVGEKPSTTASERGWRWEDGRLAASTLFDALRAAGVEPSQCRFLNLFGDLHTNPEKATDRRLREVRRLMRDGYRVVAMGKKVSRQLRVEHVSIRHPAARGAGRERSIYRAHVAAALS